MDSGQEILEKVKYLEQVRMPHEWLWQEVGLLTNQKDLSGTLGGETKGFIPHAEIYDTTLRTSSKMQANGITSMLFPRNRDWMTVAPPWHLRNNVLAKKKYREAGEACLHYARASNFHNQNHGVIVHRSQLGTGTMLMDETEDDDGGKLPSFRRLQPLKYLIDHNAQEKVETFACRYDWSAHKAALQWGKENLSPKLQKEVDDPKKRSEKHVFHMLIEKRPPWERKEGKKSNKEMRYRVVVLEEEGRHIVVDSGNDRFQVVASRYQVCDSPWGYSPAWEILPDAYKANFVAKFMLVMGERAAVPPVMAPASMKEEGVGLGAAEITYVSETNPNMWPKELSSGSNYQVGMDLLQGLRNQIDKAFNGDLFNMFSRQQRDRTATEITAMQGELNAQLDPTITALEKDHIEPTVKYIFDWVVENGIVDIPDEGRNEKTGKPIMPIFAYDNAISNNHKKMKAVEAIGLLETYANLAAAAGMDVDVVDVKKTATRIWRDHGQNEDEILREDEMAAREKAKAEAAERANMLEAAKTGSEAAKNASQAGLPITELMAQAR